MYDLTRLRFGRVAGFVAGLILALTPITVAISRHNNPDALLVLCIAAALWAVVRGLADGRTRWLVLAGVCIGLGFEAKMGAALLVVPALAVAWLWVAPRGRLAAVRGLLAGGAAMAVVGFAWPVLVWLTPASQRPWISGTSDNSIWSLILGYNGLGRLAGQQGGPGGVGGGPGGGSGVFGGDPRPLRLLNQALGGQGGWLLGFAVVVGVGLVATTRLRRADPRTGWLLSAGGAFAVTAVAFSQAQGIFHPYYVSALAPFMAALVGAGAGETIRDRRFARVAGPLAIAGGVATELVVLRNDTSGQLTWLPGLLAATLFVAAAALASGIAGRRRAEVLAAALAVLLIAPASWSVQTLGYAASGTFPAGGPQSTAGPSGPPGGGFAARFGGGGVGGGVGGGAPAAVPGGAPTTRGSFPGGFGGGPGGDSQSITAALAYARSHGGGTVAVSSQNGAASSLITSGTRNVVAIGGFSGRESQVSLTWLADAVASGKVRWVVTGGSGMRGMRNDGRVGATQAMAAVTKVGRKVTSVSGLYDLSGKAGALRALAS